jgi:YggT family protein
MISIINAVFFVVQGLLTLLRYAIVISAIISWLVAFDVINLRNRYAYMVADFLDRVTRPVLRPFQRFIPTLGGVDISPIVALLVILGLQLYILPALQATLIGLLIPQP